MEVKIHNLHITSKPLLATLSLALCAAYLYTSSPAHAEYFGLPAGRSANVSSMPDKSVEAGFITGDIADSSYQSFGARFNIRTAPDVMVYLDVAKVDVEKSDGTGFGIGFLYQIKGITQTNDFALKASFHSIKLQQSGRNSNDGDVISVEGLLSGQKIGESNLRWYANLGFHKFDFRSYDESEIGFGGGVYVDTNFGEFYAGADLIDELIFGLGVRYHLQ